MFLYKLLVHKDFIAKGNFETSQSKFLQKGEKKEDTEILKYQFWIVGNE